MMNNASKSLGIKFVSHKLIPAVMRQLNEWVVATQIDEQRLVKQKAYFRLSGESFTNELLPRNDEQRFVK